MTETGGAGHQAQARAAADGGDAGPTIGPKKGPVDRRDVLIAAAVVVALVGLVVLFALG